MYQSISFFEYSDSVLEKMKQGIFLNTKYQEKINTMIIGWGGIAVIWGRPIFLVLVRSSRATYDLLEKSGEFTVSVPLSKDLSKEIEFCGSKSMREVNKFKACNFTAIPGQKVDVPIIKEAELHFECKVIYKQDLDQKGILSIIKDSYYDKTANHRLYYGEIVNQYLYLEDKNE